MTRPARGSSGWVATLCGLLMPTMTRIPPASRIMQGVLTGLDHRVRLN